MSTLSLEYSSQEEKADTIFHISAKKINIHIKNHMQTSKRGFTTVDLQGGEIGACKLAWKKCAAKETC